MNNLRALSVGGAISLAALSVYGQADAGTAFRAGIFKGEPAKLFLLAQAKELPAWAAEAKMNPDYKPGAPESASEPAATPAAAEPASQAEAKSGGTKPAWAEEAKMNPDYKPGETTSSQQAAPAEPAAPSSAAAEPAAPASGSANAGTKPAWAEEAKMNPDYKPGETTAAPAASQAAVAPAAPSSAPAAAPDATPKADPSVVFCTTSLGKQDMSGKILFGTGSSSLAKGSNAALKDVAATLKECGDVTIEIAGHTDNVGSSEGNKSLSEARAKVVADYLSSAGIDPTKLKAVGLGDANPIASNDTDEGRKLNRRIEFKISPK